MSLFNFSESIYSPNYEYIDCRSIALGVRFPFWELGNDAFFPSASIPPWTMNNSVCCCPVRPDTPKPAKGRLLIARNEELWLSEKGFCMQGVGSDLLEDHFLGLALTFHPAV